MISILTILFMNLSFAESYPAVQGQLTMFDSDVFNDGSLKLRVIVADSCHYGECLEKPNLSHQFDVPVSSQGQYKIPAFELNQIRGAFSVVIFKKENNRPLNTVERVNDVEFIGVQEYKKFAEGLTLESVNPSLSFDFQNEKPVTAIQKLFEKEGIRPSDFGNPRYTIDVEGYFEFEMTSPQCCHLLRFTTPQFSIYRTDANDSPKIGFPGIGRVLYPTSFKNFKRNNSLHLTSVRARIFEWYSPRVQKATKSAEVSLIPDENLNIELGAQSKYTLPVR